MTPLLRHFFVDVTPEDRYPVCDCCQLEVGYVMDNGLCPICDDDLHGAA